VVEVSVRANGKNQAPTSIMLHTKNAMRANMET